MRRIVVRENAGKKNDEDLSTAAFQRKWKEGRTGWINGQRAIL